MRYFDAKGENHAPVVADEVTGPSMYFVAAGGNATVRDAHGNSATYTGLVTGTMLPVIGTRVDSAALTATLIRIW